MMIRLAAALSAMGLPASAAAQSAELTDRMIFGAEVAALGMLAVFTGLVAVYVAMLVIRKVSDRPPRTAVTPAGDVLVIEHTGPEVTDEVAHAIALALYMDLRALDMDTDEITMKRIHKPHSAWWYSRQTLLVSDNEAVFFRRGKR